MPNEPPTEPPLPPPLPPELQDITAADWGAWRQNGVTRAFRRYMRDQVANWRQAVNDLHEAGLFRDDNPDPDLRPDVLRGHILTMLDLEALSLDQVIAFYAGQAEAEREAEGTPVDDGTEAD